MMAGRVLLCCCAAAAAASATKREEMWFESAIDHFDMTSTATYKQRCLVDSSALAGSARAAPHGLPPLFFYTGNEGAIEEFAESAGLLDELVPRFGALVVFCEHRCARKPLRARRLSAPHPASRPLTHPPTPQLLWQVAAVRPGQVRLLLARAHRQALSRAGARRLRAGQPQPRRAALAHAPPACAASPAPRAPPSPPPRS